MIRAAVDFLIERAKVKGTPLHIALQGFLDATIGVATQGFIIDDEGEIAPAPPAPPGPPTPAPKPPFGGSPRPRRVVLIGLRRRKLRRDDQDLMEMMGVHPGDTS